MIAIEMEAPIINHSISVSSDQLPTNAARAKVIVMYEEAEAGHALPSIVGDEWRGVDFSKASMAQAMRGLEDDPVTYDLADIKERWK